MQPEPLYELPRDGNHIPAAGGYYSASTPTITAGNVYALQLDENGNLLVNVAEGGGGGGTVTQGTAAAATAGWPVIDGQTAPTTATWTTSTSLNTALSQTTTGYSTATVTTAETGTTTTAGALTFEVYDGTNWFAVVGQQIGSYTVQSSYSLVNNTNVAWQFDIGGFEQFRVRLSTAITGTGSPQVVVILQLQAAPSDLTPTVGWGQRLDQVNDAITNYPFGHTYTHISTTTTTTIKSGAGVLHSITINTPVASSVITVYDNTAASGTVIEVITLPATLLMEGPDTAMLDVAYSTGLTIVTATGASDITISSR